MEENTCNHCIVKYILILSVNNSKEQVKSSNIEQKPPPPSATANKKINNLKIGANELMFITKY